MAQIVLPDEHLILIGMIAIRSEVVEQLLDMLLQGWFHDLPEDLMQDVRQVGLERKASMLCDAFSAALPGERTATETLFDRLLAAQDTRRAVLHEAWVLSEAPDVRAVSQPMGSDAPRRRVTAQTLRELDRAFASVSLELTLLFARASEARTPPPPASPDRPEARD
jgi:hypothetical protein